MTVVQDERCCADPLLDLMDKANVVRWRLFREACCPYEGNYVKDLLCLGRPLQDSIIVDNSPHSYVFQPDNALPIGTFIDDPSDRYALRTASPSACSTIWRCALRHVGSVNMDSDMAAAPRFRSWHRTRPCLGPSSLGWR